MPRAHWKELTVEGSRVGRSLSPRDSCIVVPSSIESLSTAAAREWYGRYAQQPSATGSATTTLKQALMSLKGELIFPIGDVGDIGCQQRTQGKCW
jgi:hypothetical protein